MNKRQQIIETAAAVMHSKGYENTSLQDILAAAGLGKGQFYHYFSSKHELGVAIFEYFFINWNRRLMENILSSKLEPWQKLNGMLTAIIEQHRLNGAKCGCIFGNLALEMSEHDEVFRQKLEDVFALWEEKLGLIFRDMVSSEGTEITDASALAEAVVAMIEGGILLMKNKQDIEVLVRIMEQVKNLVEYFVQQHTDGYCRSETVAQRK